MAPELQLDGIDLASTPVHRLSGPGTTICESYELDAHGLVRLSIADEKTGFAKTFEIRR